MRYLKGDEPPHLEAFAGDVLAGLAQSPRSLPCKWFYDERGSRLFDTICGLPEYYLTRTEWDIMEQYSKEMAAALGPNLCLVEYGSGSSLKTQLLLKALREPLAYLPLDISREHLLRSAARLQEQFPGLAVRPVCADYLHPIEIAAPLPAGGRLAAYFPGSTIGNFLPGEAVQFLQRAAVLVGQGNALVIGVDLYKDADVLLPAYNDAAGVTAAFNLNLLQRANAELGTDFDLARWRHQAYWNEADSRMEMHLVSGARQSVHLGPAEFSFDREEHIVTEYSHKYTPEDFATLSEAAGWRIEAGWTDQRQWFGVYLLRAG